MTTLSMNLNIVRDKQPQRDAIAADLQAFVGRGGRVQQLAPGEHTQPLMRPMRAAVDERLRLGDFEA